MMIDSTCTCGREEPDGRMDVLRCPIHGQECPADVAYLSRPSLCGGVRPDKRRMRLPLGGITVYADPLMRFVHLRNLAIDRGLLFSPYPSSERADRIWAGGYESALRDIADGKLRGGGGGPDVP